MKQTKKQYPIDYSAILYLAQMRRNHTNVYRFAVTMKEAVCPELLQMAVNRIYTRFPTIFAGFQPGFFSYCVVPSEKAPCIAEDPGVLYTMPAAEIRSCAYRVYYSENKIIIEAFHALTDGYGAVASLRTLVAEYLFLRYGVDSGERREMLEQEPDWEAELQDAYLDYSGEKSARMPGRYAYQLPGEDRNWKAKDSIRQFATQKLLQAARRYGVSMTAFLSCIMAESIMEIQNNHAKTGKKQPVRIMVPIDLRRLFPSKTLRNFILYALPTMECSEASHSREIRMKCFHSQLQQQATKKVLGQQISANVIPQRLLLFRIIPLCLKLAAMRLAYRFFGESNSSITLTNLGPVVLSEELKSHIQNIEVLLTPRSKSPYNCSVISCGDVTNICITRFGAVPELEELFYRKLHVALNG